MPPVPTGSAAHELVAMLGVTPPKPRKPVFANQLDLRLLSVKTLEAIASDLEAVAARRQAAFKLVGPNIPHTLEQVKNELEARAPKMIGVFSEP
jgi:hypothetical protein